MTTVFNARQGPVKNAILRVAVRIGDAGRHGRRQGFVAAAVVGLGTVGSFTFMPDQLQGEYLAWSGASCIAAFLFASTLARQSTNAVFRWVVLLVFFVAYYLQLWAVLWDTDLLVGQAASMASAVVPSVILRAYGIVASTFSLVAVAFASRSSAKVQARQTTSGRLDIPSAARWSIMLAVVIATCALTLMEGLGIAMPGVAAEPLPYRLAGWIVYGLRVLVPALLLFSTWAGESLGRWRLKGLAMFLLLAIAVGDLLVTTSKQGIILAVLRYGMLMFLMGRMTGRRRALAVASLLILAVSFPLLSALRFERASGMAVSHAVVAVSRAESVDGEWIDGMRLAVVRVSGMACLLPVLARNEVRPDLAVAGFVGGRGIIAFTTEDVYGYRSSEMTGFAPGLVGWFFVALGDWAPLGVALFLVLLDLAWQSLLRMPLVARPIAQILFVEFALHFLVDGVLEWMPLLFAVGAGAVIAVEVLARSTGRARRRQVTGALVAGLPGTPQ